MEDFFKVLVDEAKKEGLEAAEESLKMVCRAAFRALPKAASASSNQYVQLLVPAFAMAEAPILQLIEKINPADNPQS